MAYRLAPDTFTQIMTTTGVPAVGYTLESYIYNTSTPTAMFSDASGTSLGVSCTLNSRGAPQSAGGTEVSIYLDTTLAAGYKFILKDAGGATVRTYAGPIFVASTSGDLADIADGTDAAKGSALVGHYLSGLGGTTATATTVRERLNTLSNDRLNITDPRLGSADLTGATSSATEIILAHTLGKKVYYPEGSYLFDDTDTNPDFTGGIELDGGAQWNGPAYDDILVYDRDGSVIGLQYNYQEDNQVSLGSYAAITSGVLIDAPISTRVASGPMDIIAHWYNDVGTEYRRSTGASYQWYYDSWNFVSTDGWLGGGYDPQRHSVFGHYRGDDPAVLDWQCYWLKEAGVAGVCLTVGHVDMSGWSASTHYAHWAYQLFTNCPNFKNLRYVMWVPQAGTLPEITANWEYLIDNIYLNPEYNNFYSIELNGKTYPALFTFSDTGNLFVAVGNTEAAYISFMESMADRFIAAGYGGFALICRHKKGDFQVSYTKLEEVNCIAFAGDYAGHSPRLSAQVVDQAATTYSDLVDSWEPYWEADQWESGTTYTASGNDVRVVNNGWWYICHTTHTAATADEPGVGQNYTTYWYRMGPISREIPVVKTASEAKAPLSTAGGPNWSAAGSTPELFGKWLRRAINSGLAHGTAKICMVYNVAEWAEGGPGLTPNISDGWRYLDQISGAVTGPRSVTKPLIGEEGTDRGGYIANTSTIPRDSDVVILTSGSSITMISTPTIFPGVDFQTLRIVNGNASNTITLQDRGTLADSDLYLTATTVTLGPWDSILLQYVPNIGAWLQVGPLMNVL